MSVLDTAHKRKSAVITVLIISILVFGILNYGIQYVDEPEEYGLAINFGDSEVGNGEPIENIKETVTANEEQIEEQVEEVIEETTQVEETVEEIIEEVAEEVVEEEVITNETTEEVPVVEKVKEEKKEAVKKEKLKEIVKPKPKPKPKPMPKPKPKPKPSKENQDALNSLLSGNSSDGEVAKGEGDDKAQGVKGKVDGDAKSSKYYGTSGSGSGGNYNLAGRKALSKPKEQPSCQEQGIVVVRIQVDKSGKVIYALAGVKGTTNSAPCLLGPAKAAALKTKWNTDNNAPTKQTGTIIYKFSLTN